MIIVDIYIDSGLIVFSIYFVDAAMKQDVRRVGVYVRVIPYVILFYIVLGVIFYSFFIDPAVGYFILARKYFGVRLPNLPESHKPGKQFARKPFARKIYPRNRKTWVWGILRVAKPYACRNENRTIPIVRDLVQRR